VPGIVRADPRQFLLHVLDERAVVAEEHHHQRGRAFKIGERHDAPVGIGQAKVGC